MAASHMLVAPPAHLYFQVLATLLCAGFLSVAPRCVLQRKTHGTHLLTHYTFTQHLPVALGHFLRMGPSLGPAIRRPAGYRLAPAPVLSFSLCRTQLCRRYHLPAGLCPLQTPQALRWWLAGSMALKISF